MSDLTTWQRRWKNEYARVEQLMAENTELRTALDQLNADTEQLFNDAGQEGVEKAKTHLIQRQSECIRKLKEGKQ